VIAAFAIVYIQWFISTPAAVRAFYWNRSLLEKAVQARAGELPDVNADKLGESLAQAGFTSVHDEGACTVFYYKTFMAAIDLWHEIVYCPKGQSQLPNYHQGQFSRLYEVRGLSNGQWYYVCHR
jgi:hypothetical protein